MVMCSLCVFPRLGVALSQRLFLRGLETIAIHIFLGFRKLLVLDLASIESYSTITAQHDRFIFVAGLSTASSVEVVRLSCLTGMATMARIRASYG